MQLFSFEINSIHHMINKSSRILGIIVLILGFLVLVTRTQAQNVQLKGKTFVQVDSSSKSQPIDTGYEYVDKDNVSHKVFLSKNGKAFIIRKSKKTGREYRQYLPKVTEMLKEANNDKRTD